MITHGTEIKLFAGNSNKPLAEAIAKALNMELSDIEVGRFSDGEITVHGMECGWAYGLKPNDYLYTGVRNREGKV